MDPNFNLQHSKDIEEEEIRKGLESLKTDRTYTIEEVEKILEECIRKQFTPNMRKNV
jgi:hypothetical protein